MAISTYSELQTAVQNWADDTNTLPAARCQEFIALAEADINRRLRTQSQIATATGLLSGATLTLPADFAAIASLSLSTGGYSPPLAQMAANAALEAYSEYTSGVPAHYVFEGAYLRLYPTPDSGYTYTLRYYAKVPALSDVAPTNWLLLAAPDVYLFGALTHAEGYRVNDQRLAAWKAQYETALAQVIGQSAESAIGRGFAYVEGATP
jgi:hypothetical protein